MRRPLRSLLALALAALPALADAQQTPSVTLSAPVTAPPPDTAAAVAPARPELPRVTVDTRLSAFDSTTGRTLHVPAGASLQAALDSARGGDQILLDNGATYRGAFLLRARPADDTLYVVVRPARLDSLPPEGARVTPAHAAAMPKLVLPAGNDGALRAARGAGYYRVVGVEIAADSARVRTLNALVRLDVGRVHAVAEFPHHIILDRVYVHGAATLSLTRCVLGNARHLAVVDSWLSQCHARGRDTQAFVAWNSPGPFKIVNNYLAGAGENVMFGGAAANDSSYQPSDIEFRRNHVHKPAEWKGRWTVKNLFEIKNARRILIEGNVFEDTWVDAQTGYALLIKSSAGCCTPWAVTEDVTIRYNVVRNAPGGITLSAAPDGSAIPARRVLMEHNLFAGITRVLAAVMGRLSDVTLAHNTLLFAGRTGSAVTLEGPRITKAQRLAITSNVMSQGNYGVKGSGEAIGLGSLRAFWSSYTFDGNAFVGGASNRTRYPASTLFVGDLEAARAARPEAGADLASLYVRTAGVVSP